MKTKRKLLSILLAVVMVLVMLPTTALVAYAADTIPGTTGGGQTESDPVVCNTFDEFKAAMEQDGITYVKLVNLDKSIINGDIVKITSIDHAGAGVFVKGKKTLIVTGNPTFVVPLIPPQAATLMFVDIGDDLTVTGTGTLTFKASLSGAMNSVIWQNDGRLTIMPGVTLEGSYHPAVYGRALYLYGGTTVIRGGNFEGITTSSHFTQNSVVLVGDNSNVFIYGGNFIGTSLDSSVTCYALSATGDNPNLQLSGGTFTTSIFAEDKSFKDYVSPGFIAIEVDGITTVSVADGYTALNSVNVTIRDPEAGLEPYVLENTTSQGTSITIEWFEVGSGGGLTLHDKYKPFEKGKTYEMRSTITSDVANKVLFANNVTVTINGDTSSIEEFNPDVIICNYRFTIPDPNVLSSATITVTAPVAGGHPGVPTSGTNTSISSYSWTEISGGVPTGDDLKSDDTFAVGSSYRLTVIILPADGYSFLNDATATINGNTATINMQGIDYINCQYIFTVPAEPLSSATITVTAPVAGGHPGVPAAGANTSIASNEYDWIEISGGVATGDQLNSDDTFEAGKSYRLAVIARTASGYTFTEDATATINGNTATINMKGADYINCSYIFTVPAEASTNVLSSATVTVTAPVAGGTPGVPTSGPNTSIAQYGWNGLTDDNTFEAGKTYTLNILILPDNMYSFAATPTATINENPAIIVEKNPAYIICSYTFTVPAEAPTIVLPSATVTVTAPVAGGTPGVPRSGPNTSIAQYGWNGLTDDNTFEAGKTYTLNILILPDNMYSFAATPTATINENPAIIVEKNPAYIICSYTFTVPAEASPTITGITVSPAAANVQKGTTQQFTAAVTGTGAYVNTVTWSIVEPVVAGTSINSSGLLTVAADETAATLTIKATATGDSTKTDTATVTVTSAPVTKYTLTVMNGAGDGDYEAGATVNISADTAPAGSQFKNWTTSGGGSFGDANSANTTFTMPNADTTVTAVWEDIPAAITGVTVSPTTASIQKGNSQTFTASVTGTGAYDSTVTWSVTGGVAGTSIDSSGLLTVAADETAATLTIKATANGDAAKTDTATVTVTSAPVTKYTLTVTNGAGDGDYEAGATVNITADAAPAGSQFKNWSTSGGGSFGDANSANTTFTMPNADTTVTAVWENIPATGGRSSGGGGVSAYNLTFEVNEGSKLDPIRKISGTEINLEEYNPTRDGYDFAGWYSDKELTTKVNSVKLTANTKVYAKWVEKQAQPPIEPTRLPFTDVKEGDWFYDHVKFVYENKMMAGTSATLFSPQMETSRGMIVTILYRLEKEPAVSDGKRFDDVRSGSYYENAIAWAAANNIVAGYGDNKFGPEDPITREQMATILYNFAEYKKYDTEGTADLSKYNEGHKVSSWALQAMNWANAKGLVNGKGNGILDPLGNATRSEAAAIMHSFLNNVAK